MAGTTRLGMVSPANLAYVLDNSVISALHQAGALERVLAFWPGKWLVPEGVREEARRWRSEGERVVRVLDDLCERGFVTYVRVDPLTEGPLLPRLSRTLGKGEAVAIAIAHGRRLGVALDDRAARQACQRLAPPLSWIATEEILLCAVREGYLTAAEAGGVWAATGIADPRRLIIY